MAAARTVVTLVHGTFARRAPWTRPGSRLSRALVARLGPETRLVPFEWSGRNSPDARQRASEALAARLRAQVEEEPGASHYLIGHSHGGNVALAAVAASGVEEAIDGIVCLATPFLVARERDLGSGRTEAYVGIIVAAAFLGPVVFDRLLAGVGWPGPWREAVKLLLLFLLTCGVMLLVVQWQKHAGRLLRQLAGAAVDPRKVLIVRSPADEASGFLVFGQFVSQLTVRAFLAAQRFVHRTDALAARLARRRGVLAGVFLAACVLWAASLVAYAEASNAGVSLPARAALAVFVASVIAAIEVLVLAIPGLGVQAATSPVRIVVSAFTWVVVAALSVTLVLPFGLDVAMANMLLDVTAEATPLGSWMVHTFEPPTARALGTDAVPLLHSAIYDNPVVLEFVAGWIAGGLVSRNGSPGQTGPAGV